MAFTDPQSITVSGTPHTLARVSTGVNSSSYRNADGSIVMDVSHQYGKRTRRTVRIQQTKIAPDPLISSTNIRHSMTCYVVVDVPVTGFTNTEALGVTNALAAYLTASSSAATIKLLGGEN